MYCIVFVDMCNIIYYIYKTAHCMYVLHVYLLGLSVLYYVYVYCTCCIICTVVRMCSMCIVCTYIHKYMHTDVYSC